MATKPEVGELYADAPELGRVALEVGLPDLAREPETGRLERVGEFVEEFLDRVG